MGNNSSKWDRNAHYKAMSTRKLENLRDWWLERLNKQENTVARNELELIRLYIAERIGKK